MSIKVRIPTPLQKLTQDKPEVLITANTIGGVIQELDRTYPGVKQRICDEQGNVRRFVNIFLNEEDIRFLKKEQTPVKDGDEVSIVPAIAGG